MHQCEIWYGLRDEVCNNKEMMEEAYRYCGFSQENKREEPKWKMLRAGRMEVEFTSERLNELGLKITHFK